MLIAYLIASGLSSGAMYALVALGLALVYRATSHINFAHGEQFMVGGFVAYTAHVAMGLPYVVAILAGAVAGFVIGSLSDRLVFRPLINAPGLSLILATIGLSYVMKGGARWAWGGLGEQVPFPPLLSTRPVEMFGIPFFPQQVVVICAAALIMLCFAAFFRFTLAGKMMQATSENRRAAYLVGIRVEKVYTLTWGVGGLMAAVAAVLMAPLIPLNADMGFPLMLKAFCATVIGGLGSLRGAVMGGLLVGLVESFAGGLIHTSLQSVAPYFVIVFVLAVRPGGLFGAARMREV